MKWMNPHRHTHTPTMRETGEDRHSNPKKPMTRPLEKDTMDAQNRNYFGNDIFFTLHAD